jgi:hypothetical protein
MRSPLPRSGRRGRAPGRRMALAGCLLALAFASAAGAQDPAAEWRVNRLIWEGTRALAADPGGNAARVAGQYTSYLNLPPEENCQDLRARVFARRGESWAAALEFASAEEDFRAANDLWPGSVREEFDRALFEPPSRPPGQEEPEEEEEEPSGPSEPWRDYYDIESLTFEGEGPFRVLFLSSFTIQRMAPSTSGFRSRLDAVRDLGVPSAVPGVGLNLRLHLGGGILAVIENDLVSARGEKDIESALTFYGSVFPAPGTVKTDILMWPAKLGLQFYLDKNKAHFALDMGLRVMYEQVSMEGSGHERVTESSWHQIFYYGLTACFDIVKESVSSVLDVSGMYWTEEDAYAGNSSAVGFLRVEWDWGFRPTEMMMVYLGILFDYDQVKIIRGSGRIERFSPIAFGASLQVEMRLF